MAPPDASPLAALAAGLTIATFVFTLWPLVGGRGAVFGAVALSAAPAFGAAHRAPSALPLVLTLMMVSLPLMARVRRAAIVCLPATLVALAWVWTHPAPLVPAVEWIDALRNGARAIARELAPSLVSEPDPWLAAAATLAACGALVWSTVRASGEVLPAPGTEDPRWPVQRPLLRAALWSAAACALGALAWRVIAQPTLVFDAAVLAPLVLCAVTALTIVGTRAWRVISRSARVLGVLALALWLSTAVRVQLVQARDAAGPVAPPATPR
ncbi:MAG: hypothetical protein P3B98_10980 [Gemmatimonadota bacterium]|nr:hypothetical protein [Gemmatimonadota bacterium]